MTDKDARDSARVAAMVQAIVEVLEDSAGGVEEFQNDRKTQKAIILDLIHLTESASRISREFQDRHPKVPWALMNQLRNHGLVHEYGEVDLDGVWVFVRDEIPRISRSLGTPERPARR